MGRNRCAGDAHLDLRNNPDGSKHTCKSSSGIYLALKLSGKQKIMTLVPTVDLKY